MQESNLWWIDYSLFILDICTMSNEYVFTKIYNEKIWGKGTPSSPSSGAGSDPDMSLPYLQFVKSTIQSNGIKTVFDFGHGDWTMWRDYKFEDVSYIGVDIALGLSEKVGAVYGNLRKVFLHSSKFKKDFPDAELFISKEVFQHLPNSDVNSVLSNLTKFKYVILCNGYYSKKLYIERLKYFLQIKVRFKRFLNLGNPFYLVKPLKNNTEICSGDFRGVDLENSPFSEFLTQHQLVSKFDFPGRKGSAVIFRTYFYVRNFA